jgi:hypothetical protein
MATKTGFALWLALAGEHHRETAVISKKQKYLTANLR